MMFSRQRSQAVLDRVHELGGHGVWEADMVAISLSGTDVTDEDLAILNDISVVEMLSLNDTQITDAGLVHLKRLQRLELLSLVNTRVTEQGVAELQAELPHTTITTEPPPKDRINPFTGEPFGEGSG